MREARIASVRNEMVRAEVAAQSAADRRVMAKAELECLQNSTNSDSSHCKPTGVRRLPRGPWVAKCVLASRAAGMSESSARLECEERVDEYTTILVYTPPEHRVAADSRRGKR